MANDPGPAAWRDRLLLGALRALPRALGSHLLFLLRSHPALADDWGYHVRAIHYYEPLPDFRRITMDAATEPRVSPAIEFDLGSQRVLARRLAAACHGELASIAFDFTNGYFGGTDAATYYALIRHLHPRRIVEVGSGMSTRIAAEALERNQQDGWPGALFCIEPDPQPRLTDNMPQATLLQQPVETVSMTCFDSLQENDILFIDSSHAVKFGGDVCRLFLDIVPRLTRGVWVHVHDVFFPYDYPATWLVDQRIAFNEQYLLEAFLAFNRSFAPQLCLHWLWREDSEHRAIWPANVASAASRNAPASFWMTRVG